MQVVYWVVLGKELAQISQGALAQGWPSGGGRVLGAMAPFCQEDDWEISSEPPIAHTSGSGGSEHFRL